MTRSIFDPTGSDTEHSGSRNLGPDASNISHMPPDVVDGDPQTCDPAPDQDEETREIAEAEKQVLNPHPAIQPDSQRP